MKTILGPNCNYGCGSVRFGCNGSSRAEIIDCLNEVRPGQDYSKLSDESLESALIQFHDDEADGQPMRGPTHIKRAA